TLGLSKKLLVGVSSIFLLCETWAPVCAVPRSSDQFLPRLLPPPEAAPLPANQPRTRPGSKPSRPTSVEPANQAAGGNSSPPATSAGESRSAYEGYLLGPGDKLTIIDSSLGTDEQPYSSEITVAPDGTISVYPFGVIRTDGLTLKQLTDLLNLKGEPLAVAPQIVV